MNTTILKLWILLIGLCSSAVVFGAEHLQYPSGKEHYQTKCAFCHGAAGEGVGIFPALKNSAKAEVVEKLTRYKNSKKVGKYSSLMYVRSSGLSEGDIKQLSEYIATLK